MGNIIEVALQGAVLKAELKSVGYQVPLRCVIDYYAVVLRDSYSILSWLLLAFVPLTFMVINCERHQERCKCRSVLLFLLFSKHMQYDIH